MKRKSPANHKKTFLLKKHIKCSGTQRLPVLLLLLSLVAAAVPACGKASQLPASTMDLTKEYRSGSKKNETVEIGEDFARAYCEFSLGLLRDAVNSEIQTNEVQTSEIQNNEEETIEEETIDAETSGEAPTPRRLMERAIS